VLGFFATILFFRSSRAGRYWCGSNIFIDEYSRTG
jgi:hypothetical protein